MAGICTDQQLRKDQTPIWTNEGRSVTKRPPVAVLLVSNHQLLEDSMADATKVIQKPRKCCGPSIEAEEHAGLGTGVSDILVPSREGRVNRATIGGSSDVEQHRIREREKWGQRWWHNAGCRVV